MASGAYLALLAAVAEVQELERSYPAGYHVLAKERAIARAIGRGCIVLLSSHFERYFYAVNEEAASFVNTCAVTADRLPMMIRLVHSRYAVDQVAGVAWENRADRLEAFLREDGWLWTSDGTGTLEPERILAWMKSPKPDSLIRYYRYWGIPNIFDEITRKPHTRGRLFFRVRELVDKRNNIAHGDVSAQATRSDIQRYMGTVTDFCSRADRALFRVLKRVTGRPPTWY